MEFLYEYGLFLAKAVTIVVSIGLVIGLALGAAAKGKGNKKGELVFENLSEQLEDQQHDIKRALLPESEVKAFDKSYKKQLKDKVKGKKSKEETEKTASDKSKLFVVNFNGDVHASQVDALREEITAIISIAKPEDKVLIKLESPGGVVHGYGLAASQVSRLKDAKLHTTVAVDKVAASGGYMMACVADKIISAPFAIIGSIGVVAQLPNINKLLKKNDIDIEQHTAGNFKRTLTVLGENTEEGRNKFKQELEETHVLFKQFVGEFRQDLDIEKVATGEHWYGKQALDLNLVDKIQTSDDFVLDAHKEHELYSVEYKVKPKLAEKLGIAAANAASTMLGKMSTWSITSAK
ncbi:MAG: protease SohB [Gammaproteobacteria bacterium]|nr:protease SohB [Gammaproteobacteria bacterium]